MTTALDLWRKRADAFSAVADRTTDWTAGTPCEEWAARDVVEHVVSTQREFLDRHNLAGTASAGSMAFGGSEGNTGSAGHGGAGVSSPKELWREHERLVSDLLADPDIAGQEFAGYFGPSTIGDTLAGFYGDDLIVHRWDLAVSQNLDADLTDEELDAVDRAMDTFGELAYAPGLFGPPVKVPDGAGRRTAVLARTGRRADASMTSADAS